MIRGAVFDLDGTLLDSMSVWRSSAELLLISEGYEPKPDLSEKVRRKSLWESCEIMRIDYGIPKTADELVRKTLDMMGDYYRHRFPLKPGADAFLKDLAGCGVKMCVATADDRSLTEAALARTGVLSLFSAVFTCDEVGSGKERPDIYRAAAEHLKLPHGEIMVFEDTLHALVTAADDGFLTAGVYDPYEREPEALKKRADCFLADFTDTEEFRKKYLA